MLDNFELIIDTASAFSWPEGGGFQPVEVRINGRPLIELVKAAEERWARAEYLKRLPDVENPETFRFEPGDYHYLPDRVVLLPSREWLGTPSQPMFVLDADDLRRIKTMVLGCTCGISECWFVQARIDIEPNVVRWSEFGQFHRPQWEYGLSKLNIIRKLFQGSMLRQKIWFSYSRKPPIDIRLSV